MRHSKTQKHVEGVIPKNVLTVNSIINVHLSGGGWEGRKEVTDSERRDIARRF